MASTVSDVSAPKPPKPDPRDALRPAEVVWCDHRDWLHTKGYALRQRFQAGWTPSWKGTNKERTSCEDGQVRRAMNRVMDATRLEDGAFVMLKMVYADQNPFEIGVGTWLSAEPQRSDTENHSVPIREVLQSPLNPDLQILVMPLLQAYDKPRFDTIGETVAFFRQILQGLRYLHRHNIAHRDIMSLNVMMDGSPLYSEPIHPVKNTMKRDWSGRISHRNRTECPVRYYIIDFGLSRRYKPEDLPVRETPTFGGYKSVPEFEFKNDEYPADCDPFPTDVYYIGHLMRADFTEGSEMTSRKRGFEFLVPLVADMVNDDPSKRPTMDEVVDRFEDAVQKLSIWKLRSRVAKDKHHIGFLLSISHWIRKVRLVLGRYPEIPMPAL
ncbi:kinase-like domain-containing protein [Mycena vitilis]|nr:kinase-like domain-containing protein [Mycena vitilis]